MKKRVGKICERDMSFLVNYLFNNFSFLLNINVYFFNFLCLLMFVASNKKKIELNCRKENVDTYFTL